MINTIKKFVSINSKMIELLEIKFNNSNYKFQPMKIYSLCLKRVVSWKVTFADKVKLVIPVKICNIMICYCL